MNIKQLGTILIHSLYSGSVVPRELFKELDGALGGGNGEVYNALNALWEDISGQRQMKGKSCQDVNLPILLTRGYKDALEEEQLSRYLPEEKILINKDLFRSRLGEVDLSSISAVQEKALIDSLTKDSIGLSSNDVLLYYNLIKVNQLRGKSRSQMMEEEPSVSSEQLLNLTMEAMEMGPKNISRLNGGRELDKKAALEIITKAVSEGRINSAVLSLCMGEGDTKYLDLIKGFMGEVISQRGDKSRDIFTYMGFYILFNGSKKVDLDQLNLAFPLESFVTDKIGRVKTVYYVAMLFIQAFVFILVAQIYEISVKYQQSGPDQKEKIKKLYSADNRRAMLVSNALNIASRKIAGYRSESIEVLNTFKRFMASKKSLITVNDIF